METKIRTISLACLGLYFVFGAAYFFDGERWQIMLAWLSGGLFLAFGTWADFLHHRWKPMETAPKDRPILLRAPAREGLPAMQSVCKWHPDAGFCIDELRTLDGWMDLPAQGRIEEPERSAGDEVAASK